MGTKIERGVVMIIAVLALMALLMVIGLVVSMLGARWSQVTAALMGHQIVYCQASGGSAARALLRA